MTFDEAMTKRTAFDDLIEGNFRAQNTNALGVPVRISLYQLTASVSNHVASFYSLDAFTALSGGFQTVEAFHDAMTKRREARAASDDAKAVQAPSAPASQLTAEEAIELDLVRAGEGYSP